MPHIKAKYFPAFLISSAIIVEACAAFFSVYGLTKLFAGAALAVGIMASSLELAKVVAASYLYRYWGEITKIFKVYFTSAVIILMLITSLGIYGFLSNAFQASTLGLEKDIAKLTLQEQEIERIKEDNYSLKNEKDILLKERTQTISALQSNDTSKTFLVASRRNATSKQYQTLIKEKDIQIAENNKKIEAISQNITDAKVKMIDSGADVGPIIFVSKAFGIDITTTVQWIILLFIVVFDPLALALIIAFNKLIIEREEDEKKIKEKESILTKQDKYKMMLDALESPQPKQSKEEDLRFDIPNIDEETLEPIRPVESVKEEPVVEKAPEPEQPPKEYVPDPNIKPNWPRPAQTSRF